MTPTFVDTSYWIALVNPKDEFHQKAHAMATIRRGPFMTTQWVLTEFLDGYSDPQWRMSAVGFVEKLYRQESLTIVPASDDWFLRGLRRFKSRADQNWSLTDCISFVVMDEWDLHEALTADHHFEQAGFVALLRQDPS
jgi:uncharacterized protein